MFGLAELLQRKVRLAPQGVDGFFDPAPESYCAPGYWVAVAARGRARKVQFQDLRLPAEQPGYARAIGLEVAFRQADTYPHQRHGEGKTYSPLVILDDVDQTNRSYSEISSCIRRLFPEEEMHRFVTDLCDVVGDMLDNVWSHGESTGISMAQKWNKPRSDGKVQHIEFALADCGKGFLGELARSGVSGRLGIADDAGAIRWCIQEGNSSKKREDDGWTQRLPPDAMGNPIGPDARVKTKENNHLGLGLHKLTMLVRGYGGELWLASGAAMLHIDPMGRETYVATPCPWQGVALACRFTTDVVIQRAARYKARPDELDRVLTELLGGR